MLQGHQVSLIWIPDYEHIDSYKKVLDNAVVASGLVLGGKQLNTGQSLLDDIISQLRQAECFSVLIDETADITTRELMVIYIKYVWKESEIATVMRQFLGIQEV